MKHNGIPSNYVGREQAYVKHTILSTYLQRLFMVVGRRKEIVINYVDCFSGPWKTEDADNLSDTSIGISLEQMASCAKSLKDTFQRDVTFRALYIEKDPKSFKKLKYFLDQQSYPNVEVNCLNDDYTNLLNDIVDWCESHFTFFFVDPTGWRNVVGARTMLPLLKLGKAEFLINLMYDFINRFVNVDKHSNDMLELFGEIPIFGEETPEQRQEILLDIYRKNLKVNYQGRTTYVPIQKPGKHRVHYYLVYLTRHSLGIDIFKTEAEEMENVQRITQKELKLRKQIGESTTGDMFGGELSMPLMQSDYSDNRYEAKEYLLNNLSKEPTLIDYDKWADFLEESNLYPVDFQMAIKELIKEGLVENLDANVNRRTKHIIKPDWGNKSERWVLL
jgi:three-Cys-motif partner protein